MQFEIVDANNVIKENFKLYIIARILMKYVNNNEMPELVQLKLNDNIIKNVYVDRRLVDNNKLSKLQSNLMTIQKQTIKANLLGICNPIYFLIGNKRIKYVQILLDKNKNCVPETIKIPDFINILCLTVIEYSSEQDLGIKRIVLNDNVKIIPYTSKLNNVILDNIENISGIPDDISDSSKYKLRTNENIEFKRLKSGLLRLHYFNKAKKIRIAKDCDINNIEITSIQNLEELIIDCVIGSITIKLKFEDINKKLKVIINQSTIVLNGEIYTLNKPGIGIRVGDVIIYKTERLQ